MNTGILTISLDFELHWGRFDKHPVLGNEAYYRRTREVVPRLLELFDQYRIHATWATVGGLMAESMEEWKTYRPSHLPSYDQQRYSAHAWLESQEELRPEVLFAPDLVRDVIACPGQELGSHTFSHYYTCEKGQLPEQFRLDLRAAVKIAKDKFGKELKSLVFPRNQYDETAVQIAGEVGFRYVRSNPVDWFWQQTEEESLLKRIFRTGDTLLPLGKQSFYPLPDVPAGEPLQLPASRLMRPFRGDYILGKRRISRIKEEMEAAAKAAQVYHLWWHPHNFGDYTEENLLGLRQVLDWMTVLRELHGMRSMHMEETAMEAERRGK